MTEHTGKHFPRPTPETRPYWEACRQGRLLLQRCTGCGAHQFYPRLMCTRCDGDALEWVQAGGGGPRRRLPGGGGPGGQGPPAAPPHASAVVGPRAGAPGG